MSIHTWRARAWLGTIAALAGATLAAGAAFAEAKYGPGTSATEIKVGQTIAHSGPASAYGRLGQAQAAYFKWLNEKKGGVNGRKITFISRDDGYQTPKAVENARSLVEKDEVALIFGNLGTPINMAIRPYLNAKKVPLLFIAAGSSAFNDPKNFPYVMGWQPNLNKEAAFYARYVLKTKPDARIGVLYQHDDYGKDLLNGLKQGLGDKADKMIVNTQSFQATDPTIDSQLVILKNANVDVLFLFAYAKQTAQAITKLADLNWKPMTFLHLGSASVGATLKPAGLENSKGVLTAGFGKDATDPKWANDADVKWYLSWMKENMPGADASDSLYMAGISYAMALEHVLKMAGDDLTRENIMKQAANLKDYKNPFLLPEGSINTSPDNYAVVTYMRLQKFNGASWDYVE
ncbi:ABC transporter substrate-binding protein [Camelimonas fluminis]|uniref:ABC transporter substrate-binding protein n=1 Tax=Camelimonas fluminis TaxID=1576911 RepID=A0ABV7UHZ4_9HYPH|nr:ABC transporter substrate-binding protein [Camelimonas fluminis]GHE62760.1 ABC transporter substrate-binding protein [Camelimonas fluminis]